MPSGGRYKAGIKRRDLRAILVPQVESDPFVGKFRTRTNGRLFSIDENPGLQRHDYRVNVAGGFAAAQLTSEHVVANGIHLPTTRHAYARGLLVGPSRKCRFGSTSARSTFHSQPV
jgi:hypothetical protein